ncbi:hypothetical protein GCM10023186_05740 [Hymenobacter koreensis]|uniref:Uncharacterized protein n=1 Tax=Hymenobacter koreensis TaxID=1084523 RepID=A0ABP8IUR2_9BACT
MTNAGPANAPKPTSAEPLASSTAPFEGKLTGWLPVYRYKTDVVKYNNPLRLWGRKQVNFQLLTK